MARNGKPGDNRRHGAVKKRSQVKNPKTGLHVKRDSNTGKFLSVKTSSKEPYKGIRKEE